MLGRIWIALDVDDTFDAIHGEQQLRLFNAHYDEYGFQPVMVFDGEGWPVIAMLCPAHRPSGREARAGLRHPSHYLGPSAGLKTRVMLHLPGPVWTRPSYVSPSSDCRA